MAAVIASGETDGRLRVGCCATTDYYGTHGSAEKKTWDAGGGCTGRRLSGEEVPGAGKAQANGVQHCRGKNVLSFEADNLLAQSNDVGAEGIEWRGGEVIAIINRVDRSERVFRRKDVVGAGSTKIFPNGL